MQGVWVFADAAARSAAVTSPQEGNMSFLKDTNSTEYYSGSAWVAVGGGSSSNTQFAGKNAVINGGMDIWQRGTTFTNPTSRIYTSDRWQAYRFGYQNNITISRVASAQTGFQYDLKLQRSLADAQTGALFIDYALETSNSLRFAGQTVTLSFYAKTGSTSNGFNSLSYAFSWGTTTDQQFSSITGGGSVATGSVTLTTSMQRFTVTGTVPSNSTQLGFELFVNPTGVAGANEFIQVTGVQLEVGSSATSFQSASGSTGGELALCQRYYYRTSPTASGSPVTSNGGIITTTIAQVYTPLPVTMRANPSAMENSAINWYNFGNNTEYNTGTFTLTAATPNFASVRYTHGSAVFTAGQVGAFTSAGSSSYIAFTAEL
jgi:hypothetical protein